MLGKILRILRNDNKLSQKEFAKILGVSESRYNQYETSKRSPDFSLLIQIANYYDVSLDYLLGRIDSFQTPKESTKKYFLSEQYLKLAEKMQDAKLDADIVDSMLDALIKMKK